LLKQPLQLEEGYLVVPQGPGLGIELNEDAIRRYPPVDKVLDTPLGYDGSVQDR
jgi:galactonate dehydratase